MFLCQLVTSRELIFTYDVINLRIQGVALCVCSLPPEWKFHFIFYTFINFTLKQNDNLSLFHIVLPMVC